MMCSLNSYFYIAPKKYAQVLEHLQDNTLEEKKIILKLKEKG
jgi:hypothetical protein